MAHECGGKLRLEGFHLVLGGKVLIDETTDTGKVHQRFKDQKNSPTPSRSYTPSVRPRLPGISAVEESTEGNLPVLETSSSGGSNRDDQAWQNFKRLQAGSKDTPCRSPSFGMHCFDNRYLW